MRTIKKRAVLVLSIIFLVCACAFCMLNLNVGRNVCAEGLSFEYNEKVVLPDDEIEYEGNVYTAKAESLVFPSGKIKSGNSYTLNEYGKYTIRYAATIDKERVYSEKAFYINFPLLKTGKSSSFSYGSHEAAPEKQGMVVSIANGERFTLNKIIDLSSMSKENNLFSFFLAPATSGTADCNEFCAVLTDVYDSQNYVTIRFRSLSKMDGNWADSHCYITANSNGQPTIGARHVGDKYGYPVSFCMTGNVAQIGSQIMSISMDYATKSVYTGLECMYSEYKGKPIAELGDISISNKIWNGFTTGEAYLSFYGFNYNSSSVNVVFTDIAGEDLTVKEFKDETAPKINFDLAGYTVSDLPHAVKNKEYKLFSAEAIDAYSGKCDVEVHAYLNYETPYQSDGYIKGGVFIPNHSGDYTLVYSARDAFGNKAEESLSIFVESDNNLEFDIENRKTSLVAGEKTKLFEDLSVRNALGNVDISIVAKGNGQTYVADEKYNILPMYAGKYTVTVTVKDYVQTETETYEIEVAENPTPVIIDDVVLPRYFIKGQTYRLPDLSAYDLSGGKPSEIKTEIYVSEDGASENRNGNEYIVGANGFVNVIYKSNNSNGTTEKRYTVPVIDVGFGNELDVNKYFAEASGNVEISKNDEYMTLSSRTEGGRVIFINPLQTEELELKFKNAVGNKYGRLNLYLTDSKDDSVKIKLSYINNGGNTDFCINDGTIVRLATKFDGTGAEIYSLKYYNETLSIKPENTLSLNVSETISGESFNGFASSQIYLEIEFEQISERAELIFYSINNQSLFNFDVDIMEPQVFAKKSNGDVALGEKIKIYGGKVYDVLDVNCTLTLEVKDPNGNVVVSNDGTKLDKTCDAFRDYEITASVYGTYSVQYVGTDSTGSYVRYRYGFRVADFEKPVIELNKSSEKLGVGEEIKIRTYKVSDNMTKTEKLKVSIFVMNPDYVLEQVTNRKYITSKAGVYTVCYMVTDEAGNTAMASYKVVVGD